MKVQAHSLDDFALALRALLPPGEAWEWPVGGAGDALLRGTAAELARVDGEVRPLLDRAIEAHRWAPSSWRLVDYQRVADESQSHVIEALPRKAFCAGSTAGQRLWRQPPGTFTVPLTRLSGARPFCAGSGAGQRLWGPRARYVLIVRYYKTVADVPRLWEALLAFRLAHVYLFFMDITESGGEVSYAQN